MDESCNGPDRYREMTFARTNVDIRVMLAHERIEEIASLGLGSNRRLFEAQVPSHQIWFRSKGEKKSEGKARTTFSRQEMKVRRASGRCSSVLRILG